jgi:phage repressor protein C with HTH and peptisase S24 domain
MSPTYSPGDWLVVCWGARAKAGDVVVAARADGTEVIKRIKQVQGGQWWLEGDNPAESTDSRSIGPFDRNQIKAKVLFRYWRGNAARS